MIYENIIPKIYQDELLDFFSSNLFPWRYEPGTTYSKNTKLPLQQNFGNTICLDKNTIDSQQFIHVFLFNGQVQSPALDRVKPILYFLNDRGIEIKNLKRIKANLIVKESTFPDNCYNIPHVDSYREEIPNGLKSFLYYINDSDGDTIFFKEKLTHEHMPVLHDLNVEQRVTPKMGSGVLFDSFQFHASSPPRKTDARMVLNFIFN